MQKILPVFLSAFLLLSCSGSKELVKDGDFRYEPVKYKIKDINISDLPHELTVLSDPRSGIWSVEFYDLDKKETLFEYNKNKNLLPASNLKIVTPAAALKVLGPDYRFETEFFTDGYIDRDLKTLFGNLYVKGSVEIGRAHV